MKDLWKYLIEKLPVKWIIIYTGVILTGYYGLEFYKEKHDHEEQMAQILKAQPNEAGLFNDNKRSPGMKVIRINDTTEIIKAEGTTK